MRNEYRKEVVDKISRIILEALIEKVEKEKESKKKKVSEEAVL